MSAVGHRIRTALVIAGLLAAGRAWAAGEVCVTCKGPDASYRCKLEGSGALDPSRVGDRVAQFICVSELARRGGHESCSVRNDGFPTCVGELRAVGLTGPLPDAPPPAQPPAGAAAAETAKSEPPKTMVDLAKRTGEASKAELQKTGKAVEGAVKKTWDCLATLFTQC